MRISDLIVKDAIKGGYAEEQESGLNVNKDLQAMNGN
jgi:hypothetical protein